MSSLRIFFASLRERLKQINNILIRNINSLIGLIAIISFIFSYILTLYGASLVGTNVVVIAGFLSLLSVILLVIFYYNLYKENQKFVLGVICLISLAIIIWLYSTTKDSNVLSGGFTFILVIITAWYAGIMKEQSIIMRKQVEIQYKEHFSKEMELLVSPLYSKIGEIHIFLKGSYYQSSGERRTIEYYQFWNNIKRYQYLGSSNLQKALNNYFDHKSTDVKVEPDEEYKLAENMLYDAIRQRYDELKEILSNP